MTTVAPLLRPGDVVRVIAPSRRLRQPFLDDALLALAEERLVSLGLRVEHAAHVDHGGLAGEALLRALADDLHDAFRDPAVRLVLTAIGGFVVNRLLERIDWELLAARPKRLQGASDNTVLVNAAWARSGLVGYHGPQFYSFGERHGFASTLEAFRRCHFEPGPLEHAPSTRWSEDRWASAQETRTFHASSGPWALAAGEAEGHVLGGNLCSFVLLCGTPYMPRLADAVLFLEEVDYYGRGDVLAGMIERHLRMLAMQPGFREVRALVLGRFQRIAGLDRERLAALVHGIPALRGLPVVADVDFGHTTPSFSFPVGARVRVEAGEVVRLVFTEH